MKSRAMRAVSSEPQHFEPMRCALEAWADQVQRIVEGRPVAANILPLRWKGGAA